MIFATTSQLAYYTGLLELMYATTLFVVGTVIFIGTIWLIVVMLSTRR